jgi:hypothetical protein
MTSWTLSTACLLRKHENGEATIINEAAGKYYVLNATARLVVEGFRQGLDTEETAKLIEAQYHVDLDRARKDVAALTLSLVAHGVLTSTGITDVSRP